MSGRRQGLSAIYGFIVIFTLLMAGMAAALTIMNSETTIWNAQDRARQVHASQQSERLALSINGTSLNVRNVGLVPSQLLYLYQKGVTTSFDKRLGNSLQQGSNLSLVVSSGMLSFAVITSLGNVFWTYNSTASQAQSTGVPVTFDASGLDPSYGSSVILTVDGTAYPYSSLPRTFDWNSGSQHAYAYSQSFPTGSGTRVGWSYARGLSSTMAGTVYAVQPGSIVSAYAQQFLLSVTGGSVVQYIGSPSNDGWYNAGGTAQVSTDYVWNLSAGQTRQNLFSWNLDGGANQFLTRAGSGVYTTTQISMNTFHTVNSNSVTQYVVTTHTSVPSSGSTGALIISYSYSTSSTLSNSANGATSVSVSMPGSGTVTSLSGSIVASETQNSLGINQRSYDSLLLTITYGSCSANSQWYTLSSSPQTFAVSASCSNTPTSGGVAALSTTLSANCLQGGNDAGCGTPSYGQSSVSATYSTTGSGTASSSSNAYSVSGNTVTYIYGIGYSFPGGSTSASWSASWPSTEGYYSSNCAGATVSGHTITGTDGSCTLTTVYTGTYSTSLGGSPTGDGWYDGGASVGVTASGSGPFSFSSWSGPSGITIASSGSASTTIGVNTYGTVTASFYVNQ